MDMISFLASEPFDRSGDTPLYVQLKHRIALLIASQAFDTKTPLPRELEICERLELSRATVRRCFQDLVIEGRVVRKRGQGTFIKPQTSAPGIDLALNFSARMREAGRVPSSQILAFSSIPAVRGIASGLKVPEGTPVWEIRRLRLANDKPMELNYVYIPVSLCPELTRKDVDGSLYAYIAEKTGILPASVDAVYETVNLDKHEARLLGQNTGKAAMRIVRSTYDKTGTPFEVGVLISCDGQAKLHVHIAADKTTPQPNKSKTWAPSFKRTTAPTLIFYSALVIAQSPFGSTRCNRVAVGRGGRRSFLSENFAKPSFREKVSGCRPGRPGHITPCPAGR